MARPSQARQLPEDYSPCATSATHGNAPPPVPDNDITPSRASTRIPETILPTTTPPARPTMAARPTTTRRDPDITNHEPNANNIDSVRIRNSILRADLRMRSHELRRSQQESDHYQREATEARQHILHYRNELRATRVWMEVAVFVASVVVVCVVLYVGWCWLNSAEFELQRKVLRRNIGLE